MIIKELTGIQLQQMVMGGSQALERQKEAVNALNVFPVPDGDTGTNMHLTIQSAAREVGVLQIPGISQAVSALSMGSLMGARGNSGVILSQLFRGFAKGLENTHRASGAELAKAMQLGVDTAYKAVMKPVEGTILTVAKESAKGAARAAKQGGDVVEVLEAALRDGELALARTPDMLPTLKQAGVVDAGGKGFLVILQGWLSVLKGEEIEPFNLEAPLKKTENELAPVDLTFQYCTEFILKGAKLELDTIKNSLCGEGDCLLVVGTDEVAKIHIHTNHPGKVLEKCISFGSLHEVQIHNMKEQSEAKRHAEKEEKQQAEPGQLKEIGLVAVAVGQGLVEIMRSLGVDSVIEGGQTMNPSTEDLVSAINRVKAKRVFVLPNNGNIILAAKQAGELVQKQVYVVETKSIPEGIAAVLAFDPEASFGDNASALSESFKGTKSGEVTYAVRDSQYDGHEIKEGDILGLINDKVALTGSEPSKVTLELVDRMGGQRADLISLFSGQDVDEEKAAALAEDLRLRFPNSEVEVHRGGQPLYYYIVSVE